MEDAQEQPQGMTRKKKMGPAALENIDSLNSYIAVSVLVLLLQQSLASP